MSQATEEPQQERKLPTYQQIARALRELAAERDDWSGMPMLIGGLDLITEPRYKYHQPTPEADTTETDGDKVVNSWFCSRYGCWVHALRSKDGRHRAGVTIHNKVDKMLGTMMAVQGWLVEAESAAIDKLATMLPHHLFVSYLMTGMFIETSKRSGVTYLFRRLKPTIAMKANKDGEMRVLCALCLHPVGYYAGTWAGAQTPTDDVISHLVFMRGDEPKFWANANQHPAHRPESGI